MNVDDQRTQCCIAGGGPAGMLLGLLLARAGVAVTVLEKHADFLRDFRGDTVHPATLALIDELGLRAAFDALPQDRVQRLSAIVSGTRQPVIDFRGLKPYDYLALVPQWHFLDMLAGAARAIPGFDLRLRHAVIGRIEEDGRTVGVQVAGPDGPYTLRADLVVACDGRHSTLRASTTLPVREFGAPMDVLWLRLPRRGDDPRDTFGLIERGGMLVLLNRDSYWQAAFLVPKGSDAALRSAPIGNLQQRIAQLAPFLADRAAALADWKEVSTLTVRVDRLQRWYQSGLLLIGDAAHAMSPIGGVGINLALQDAVATANALAAPLRAGTVVDAAMLAAVQRRREWPVRVVQRVQIVAQQRLLANVLAEAGTPLRVPAWLRLLLRFRVVRNLPARLFGYGLRREHVRTPQA